MDKPSRIPSPTEPASTPAATAAATAARPSAMQKSSVSPQIQTLLQHAHQREALRAVPEHVTSNILAFALNTLCTPLLIVDRTLTIAFANSAAETALAGGQVLSRAGGQLRVESSDKALFLDAVNAAGRGCPLKRALILPGTTNSAAAVWFRPIDGSLQTSSLLWSRGLVVISFRLLPTRPAVSKPLLCKHFALTPKEAELLSHLAGGCSVGDIAALMQIKTSTVRSHLAKCFQKTGTHRQPDLVSLVLSLASPVQE